jgi:hypothetical protein
LFGFGRFGLVLLGFACSGCFGNGDGGVVWLFGFGLVLRVRD